MLLCLPAGFLPIKQRLTDGGLRTACEHIRRIHMMSVRINYEESSGLLALRLLNMTETFLDGEQELLRYEHEQGICNV